MEQEFGRMSNSEIVYQLVLKTDDLQVKLITYGAAIQSIDMRDREAKPANVVLGLATLNDYIAHSPHFGAVPGRYAGRIAFGRFSLDGRGYQLPCNDGKNSLHGGPNGFGKRPWSLLDNGPRHAVLGLHSPDGDSGYPGSVNVEVRYSLEGSTLRIDYTATTDQPTIINLTNHSYFNLAGEGSGTVEAHQLKINANVFAPIDANSIPTGELRDVARTPFDFRAFKAIGAQLREADEQILLANGYDHGFVLSGQNLKTAASLYEPRSGRTLNLSTTAPAVQLYTGNMLTGSLAGPSQRSYRQTDGVCLEAQHLQDSPNQPNFPSTVLRPSTPFCATTIFDFSIS